MNALVIAGHPNPKSFNRALAEAYATGLREGGAVVRVLELDALDFDPILHRGYERVQPLEPDLVDAQKSMKWADHLVLAYPVWWGAPPALLKGFFDRTFLPGWAFEFQGWWPLPKKLLTGRSAHVIVTMDSPRPVYQLLYRGSAHRAVIQGVLGFCGVGPVSRTTVGAVKYLPKWMREAQLAALRRRGRRHAKQR